jgi:hypothetical protein
VGAPGHRVLVEGLVGGGPDQRRVGHPIQRGQRGGQVAVQQRLAGGGLGPVEVDQPYLTLRVDHDALESHVVVGDPGLPERGGLLPDGGQQHWKPAQRRA